MKLFCIEAGILFLINPIFGLHDYLPDFIGCFLIMLGIRDVSYMVEKLAAARRWFMYAAFVSIVRFLLIFTGAESQHTLPLTLSFCLAVVEIIVYIPAFRNFFSGFDYAAMRLGGSGILSLGRRKGFYTDETGRRSYGEIQDDTTGRLSLFSQVFIIIRAAASVLPELPDLQISEHYGEVGGFQFSSIENLIKLTAAVIVLIPGIILFFRYLKFFGRVKKSGDFLPAVNAELDRRFGNLNELNSGSQMKALAFVIGVSAALYMGFYDYQINIVPRAVSAVAVCAAAVLMFFVSGRKLFSLLPVVPAAAAIPVSLKTYALQKGHYSLYKMQMMELYKSGVEYVYDRQINSINDGYMMMAVWECMEAVLCGVAIILLLAAYRKISKSHAESFRSVPERDRTEILKSLKIRGTLMIAGSVLSALYFAAYRFILPYFDLALMTGVLINTVSVILFILYSLQAFKYVYSSAA